MNKTGVVVQWYVDEEINDKEFVECMENLNVSKPLISRLLKWAKYQRSVNKAAKENATPTQAKENTKEEV